MPQSVVVTGQTSPEVGLARIAAALASIELRLAGPEADRRRRALHTTITGYLLPKVTDPAAPLIAAVVGPSGTGKSTLVNALAGHAVAAVGPVRPTTRAPSVWAAGELPPNLVEMCPAAGARVTGGMRPPPEGMVLVDAPPPGVVSVGDLDLAALLLEIADVCVLVASERRYADAAAWRLIDIATRRRLPTIGVLNRLTGDAATQRLLREDMARHLVRRGLLQRLHPEGVLGVEETDRAAVLQVAHLRKELESLADPQARHAIVKAGVGCATAEVRQGLVKLRETVALERTWHQHLARLAGDAYESERAGLRSSIARGELGALVSAPDRVALHAASIVGRRANAAAKRAASAWDAHPVGRSLLQHEPALWTHDADTPRLAREAVQAWKDSLPALAVRPSGRPMPPRWRKRIAEAAFRASLEPGALLPGRLRRRASRIPGLAHLGRRRLSEAIGAVLESDRIRFLDVLGAGIPDGIEESLRMDWES